MLLPSYTHLPAAGKGEVLYDELVHPEHEVTDHLTNFSGIQPGSLDDVTNTLADVCEVRGRPAQRGGLAGCSRARAPARHRGARAVAGQPRRVYVYVCVCGGGGGGS